MIASCGDDEDEDRGAEIGDGHLGHVSLYVAGVNEANFMRVVSCKNNITRRCLT